MQDTLLFNYVPRNYWPALYEVIKVIGARSALQQLEIPPMNRERPEWARTASHPVDLDTILHLAFSWVATPQGFGFWSILDGGIIDAQY